MVSLAVTINAARLSERLCPLSLPMSWLRHSSGMSLALHSLPQGLSHGVERMVSLAVTISATS
jgi:hypothetical protein